ncbi:hypothetical protein B0H19DRAFT_184587 [Mycena capillaripes]|nr:hypothetical protein B0H19DRAFT_184587 [Mycena capillaripes]
MSYSSPDSNPPLQQSSGPQRHGRVADCPPATSARSATAQIAKREGTEKNPSEPAPNTSSVSAIAEPYSMGAAAPESLPRSWCACKPEHGDSGTAAEGGAVKPKDPAAETGTVVRSPRSPLFIHLSFI